MSKWRFAVICASNQNRSMETHDVLRKKGMQVRSYGTGDRVKLPGPSIDRPNVYAFGTPYRHIFEELKTQDPDLYTDNGILPMLERNQRIKEAPERFQDMVEDFDVVLTCEARCFDSICDDLRDRKPFNPHPIHIVNLDIRDTAEDATIGARLWLQFCQKVEELKDLDAGLDQIIEEFQERTGKELLHAVI